MKLQNLVYSRYSGFVFFPRSVYALPGRAANLSLPETCMRWPATVLDMIEHMLYYSCTQGITRYY